MDFWLVPYLFPAAVNTVLEREDLKDYDSAMRAFLSEQKIDFSRRNVLLAHQFVAGDGKKPQMGGSETTVGGIGQIDASALKGFDYAALGHIHNAQAMGGAHIRYAGSPLKYHFSECGQTKGLTVVELKEMGEVTVTIEELPALHGMEEIAGTLEEILAENVAADSYIRAVIRQEILPPRTVELLREHFKSKDCILMEVVRECSTGRKKQDRETLKDIRTLSLEELFGEFYSFLHDGELPDGSLEALISFAAEQTRNSPEGETEKEKKQAAERFIAYALKCQTEEKNI